MWRRQEYDHYSEISLHVLYLGIINRVARTILLRCWSIEMHFDTLSTKIPNPWDSKTLMIIEDHMHVFEEWLNFGRNCKVEYVMRLHPIYDLVTRNIGFNDYKNMCLIIYVREKFAICKCKWTKFVFEMWNLQGMC